MLHLIPAYFEKLSKTDLDKEVLRFGIVTELNAINFYEQLSALTINKSINKILLDFVKEKKAHVERFQTLLVEYDHKQREEKPKKGKKLTGKLLWNMY